MTTQTDLLKPDFGIYGEPFIVVSKTAPPRDFTAYGFGGEPIQAFGPALASAIAVKSTANAGSASTASMSVPMPAGRAAGDVTLVAAVWMAGTITWPAGWTPIDLASTKLGFAMAYRAYQAGDPASITVTNSVSGWCTASAITYSGCDTANPIDSVTMDTSISPTFQNSFRAPRLVPRYRGGRVLSVFAQPNTSTGGSASPVVPGKTKLLSNNPGPSLAAYDSIFDQDADTGEYILGWDNRQYRVGVNIALRVAAAVASPVVDTSPFFAGYTWTNVSTAAYGPDLGQAGVQDGDLVFVVVQNVNTISAPAGWSTLRAVAGVNTIYYRVWKTGDPVTPSFGISPSSWHTSAAFLVRKRRADASDPQIDTHNTASATSSATTPNLAPADAAGLFVGLWGVGNQTGPTVTATPALAEAISTFNGPSMWLGWKQPAGSPTGQYTTTISNAFAMAGTSMVIKSSLSAPPASSGGKRKPRPWQAGSIRGNSYRRP